MEIPEVLEHVLIVEQEPDAARELGPYQVRDMTSDIQICQLLEEVPEGHLFNSRYFSSISVA